VVLAARAPAVTLQDIRTEVHEREGVTRCVIQLSGETEFFHRDYLLTKKYFLVDVYNVRPAVAERFITPASGPVRQVLVLNRRDPDTQVLTLVFYPTDACRYRVLSVKDPFRIVIDVWRSPEAARPADVKSQPVVAPGSTAAGASAVGGRGTTLPSGVPQPAITPMARPQASQRYRKTGKKIVILDPGHGGNDPGAESYVRIGNRKVQEKDLNLNVALDLKRLIDASPNVEAFLTRSSDKFVSLGDRQQFCDRYNIEADLFVSIHCNASDSYRARGARGIELYYLNPTGAAKGSLRYLEDLENRNGGAGGNEGLHNLDHPIFGQLARERLLNWLTEGRIVCEHLKSACYQIPYYKRNGNREATVQSAFFRVLFQLDMPAVLVEIGYLTNSTECQQLVEPQFQQQVATALYNGIVAYFKARDERFEPKYLTLRAGP
jgi:N-acetylmuramoyl-L-alanine amidase